MKSFLQSATFRVLLVVTFVLIVITVTTRQFIPDQTLSNYEKLTGESDVVSIMELIAYPEKYHQKKVSVVGFCHIEFESNQLQIHSDTKSNNLKLDTVWLSLGWPVPESYEQFKDKRVVVTGVFNKENKGHWGNYSGAVEEVENIRLVTSE